MDEEGETGGGEEGVFSSRWETRYQTTEGVFPTGVEQNTGVGGG